LLGISDEALTLITIFFFMVIRFLTSADICKG
jgi:hypothetical protein